MLIPSPIQKLPESVLPGFNLEVWVKRDDLIHSIISGNKYRKLQLNLEKIKSTDIHEIVTFGGAHSNHIVAMAYLCNQLGIRCKGIIRGETNSHRTPTLIDAEKYEMKLEFVSRQDYKQRYEMDYIKDLNEKYPHAIIIPEGGANEHGIKGCEAIVSECQMEVDFDYITVDCGTGATLAGMVRNLKPHQIAIGVQVLKGADFITPEVHKFNGTPSSNFEVWTDYHFGGYAKYRPELIEFMRWFYRETEIKLDPIYTGKQFYAVFDQIRKNYFPKGSKLILVHTGGLQGIRGFEDRYGIKVYD